MNQDKTPETLPEEPTKQDTEATESETVEAPESQEADASESNEASPQAMLAAKEEALAELSNKHMRLAAEYDNYRRRSQREKQTTYSEAVADVVRQWLPVLDDLDRAQFAASQYENEEARQVCEGINMIQKQVCGVLDQLGVVEIDCQDQAFDPELHEAVMHVEDETVGPSTVVEVLRKGYRHGDRVIRHAMVKVAN